MERKEQTGHICRWMACGIMAAIIIVGCTIVIGLFEWRDRKEIECKNTELHQWRKNVHDLNMHIAELSLLGETVADWDSTDVSEYHALRQEVDSMFQGIAEFCPKKDVDTIRHLLAEKERLLLYIRNIIQERNDTHTKLTAEVPKIVEKNKAENKRLSATAQQAKPKKRGFFSRLFGRKKKSAPTSVSNQPTQTERMLTTLNQTVIARHQQQSRKIEETLDSLGNRNESINRQLQKMIAHADEKVENGIALREQQIENIEDNYTYYYMGMFTMLLLVLCGMFLLVRRNKKRTDRLIGALNAKNKQNTELIKLRRQTIQAITHELRIPLATIKHNLSNIKKNAVGEVAISQEAATSMEQMLPQFGIRNSA